MTSNQMLAVACLPQALQAEGKMRHVRISEASPEDIRKAHAVTPLTAVQLEWSLWSRDAEVGCNSVDRSC